MNVIRRAVEEWVWEAVYLLHSRLGSLRERYGVCRGSVVSRPVEGHRRARDTIIAGPITTSFCMRQDRNVGRGVPSPSDYGSGECRKLPRAETGFYAYLGRPYVQCRSYKMLVMFLFFQRVISEIPLPITVKLCHMIGNWSYFIIQLQKFGGSPPQKKNWGPKTCKISVHFTQPPTLIVNISGTA